MKRMMAPIHPSTPECSYPIEVVSLPSEGRSNDLAAILEEREAVVARLGLQELSSLTASLLVARTSGGFIAVTGYFEAEVVQTCVVTLVPVRSRVRENISAMFMEDGSASADKKHSGAEELISIEDDDPPELVKEGLIDLGELVVEQLALALDPYPRAPGVNFGAVTWGSDEVGETPFGDKPFAVLGKLKNIKPS